VNSLTDQQLLRDYTGRRSEAAFAELVRRHVDFVYSAALRMVRDAHLAEDVTQGAFVALAQNAGQLTDRPVLSGWLHRTAQNLAANIVRSEVRRRAREQEAAAMNELLATESNTIWEHIAPHLDAALGELNEPDRDALLLRYFERKSAREMAQTLGTTEDAAQKRVSRAVERLREFFSKRNVRIGTSGLAVLISANAVQAAPAGLAAAISTAAGIAGATIASTATATAIKTIAMTTLQKALITTALAVVAGTGIYEARQASRLREENQSLQQQQAPLAEQIRELQRERDDATNRLAMSQQENAQLKQNTAELLKLRGEVARLHKATGAPSETQNDPRASLVESWLAREDKLKKSIEQYPDKAIPELQLLSEQQWLDAAMNAKFDTDKAIRQTLADLRHTAENNFASLAQPALSKYIQANNGQFPTDLSQLQPYFETPIGDAILSRWEILPQSALPNQKMGSDWVITEKAPVDPEFDNRWAIGSSGYGNTSYQSPDVSAAIATINPAMKAYAAANNGKEPTDPSQILPYLTTPEQQAAYQTLLKKRVPVNSASQ
jgi:RNA polymerase sigma factor (sigma-70 family)